MCHDMCKCFGRVGENREGMETGDAGREGGDAAICVALVKGETQIAVDIGKRTFISIHAPAKGATRPLTRPSSSARYFNPRSREGSDVQRLLSKRTQYHFNPRSREGSDIRSGRGGQAVAHFNLRSREGSDAYSSAFWRVITNFNPRSREGSDNSSSHSCRQIKNFNPRSREGSDPRQASCSPTWRNFNPRSREGSDVGRCDLKRLTAISIHAPVKGATPHCQ